jgi:cyanobactin biosynthesis protein (PatB/AcyB/McaB family)
MRLPIQAKPVKRPDLIEPHTAVDVEHGTGVDLMHIRAQLTHGANYNDPPAFRRLGYERMKSSGSMSSFLGGR